MGARANGQQQQLLARMRKVTATRCSQDFNGLVWVLWVDVAAEATATDANPPPCSLARSLRSSTSRETT